MDLTKVRTAARSIRFTWRMVLIAVLVSLGIAFAVMYWIPFFLKWADLGGDWYNFFRPAVIKALSGQSPYNIDGFFSPPWSLAIMIPFLLLPPPLDVIAWFIVSISTFIFVLIKLKASRLVIVLFLLTPNLWWGLVYSNFEWLVALGFILPPQIGIICVLVKPQIGAAIAFFWTIEAWRKGGIREVMKVCAPFGAIVVLSLILFGWWPASLEVATDKVWNIANWPYMLPIGVVLLTKAIRERKHGLAISAGPFLSPYIGTYSLPLAVLGLLPNELETVLAILALWFVFFIRGTT